MTNLPIRHMNRGEPARRWSLSPRTLAPWRWLEIGLCYLKVDARVNDVYAF